MKTTVNKWKDPEYKRRYNQDRYHRLKEEKSGISIPVATGNGSGEELTPWAKRKMEKKARQEASMPHPLGLESCPFCSASFFRKVGDNYEPIKMDHCDPCGKRFYYYNGVKL